MTCNIRFYCTRKKYRNSSDTTPGFYCFVFFMKGGSIREGVLQESCILRERSYMIVNTLLKEAMLKKAVLEGGWY